MLSSSSSASLNQHQLIFDFTKRKRWADLLVSELTEAIMLVLSHSGQIWFCGPAVHELLGWADEEVVDGNFCDIMNPDDRQVFQRQFTESIQNRSDLLAYARLQCKSANDLYPNIPAPSTVLMQSESSPISNPPPTEILFEITGYPHFVSHPQPPAGPSNYSAGDFAHYLQTGELTGYPSNHHGGPTGHQSLNCFFAMAKPYPSRNTAMLNTFLELKMENERLQARVQAARAKAESLKLSKSASAQQLRESFAQAASMRQAPSGFAQSGQPRSFSLSSQSLPSRSYDSSMYHTYDSSIPTDSGPAAASNASSLPQDDDATASADPNLPRKKSKRNLVAEMYVCMTCGRTDSPEWRKGPQGPKTLCNACGLRWAKSVRISKEGAHAQGPSSHPFTFGMAPPTVGSDGPPGTSTTVASVSPGSMSTRESSASMGPGAPFSGATFDYLPAMRPGQSGLRWY